jgi:hypothetical protein
MAELIGTEREGYVLYDGLRHLGGILRDELDVGLELLLEEQVHLVLVVHALVRVPVNILDVQADGVAERER